MAVAELLKDYGSAVAWIIAAAGWFVGNRQSNTRERRKEVRSELDEIEDICDSFIEQLNAYFRITHASLEEQEAALNVKMHAKAIDYRIARLLRRKWSFQNGHGTTEHLKAAAKTWETVFDAATGGCFESAQRFDADVEVVQSQLMLTRSKVLAFIEDLHRAFLYEFDA